MASAFSSKKLCCKTPRGFPTNRRARVPPGGGGHLGEPWARWGTRVRAEDRNGIEHIASDT
jgi:hypothetical protein